MNPAHGVNVHGEPRGVNDTGKPLVHDILNPEGEVDDVDAAQG